VESRGSILGIHADWQAITLCVLAASTFWFFNAMNNDHTADVSYPVEFLYNKEKYIPVKPLPEKVQFNATGFGWNLLRKTLKINRKPVLISLDDVGSFRYITAQQLLPVLKSQLDDIKINYLLQDTVYFKFDALVERSFSIHVDSNSVALSPGYKITSPVRITPNTFQVQGPGSVVKAMKDSFYIQLPEKDIDKNYHDNVDLELDLPNLVTTATRNVEIAFSVEKFIQESVEVPLIPKNFPADSSVVPIDKKVFITALVKPTDLNFFQKDSFSVVLDYEKLNTEDSTIIPILQKKHPYIKEFFITPPTVKVERIE